MTKMEDVSISRQAVIDLIADYDMSMGQVVRGIYALPPVTPQLKIGKWLFVDAVHEHARCSNCAYGVIDLVDGEPHNYCPNCGSYNGE